MLYTIVLKTARMIQKLFAKQQQQTIENNACTNQEKNISCINNSKDLAKPDSIIFQPNSIVTDFPIECANIAKTDNNKIDTICMQCEADLKLQIEKLSRFYEIDTENALKRGLWLLAIVREAEISNKKIGVITVDNSNIVTNITPINVV